MGEVVPTPETSIEARSSEQYRVADVYTLPAADNLALVHARGRQRTQYLRAELVDLLFSCDEFRTLDEHVRVYVRGRGSTVPAPRVLGNELKKLADSGYMVSRTKIVQKLKSPLKQVTPQAISTVGFPTCDRVGILERGARSYIDNCRQFDRSNDFVIMDGSEKPETRNAYRSRLRTLASEFNVSIRYAGLEEKLEFVRKLVETKDLPDDVVRFVCLGDTNYLGTMVGANRNSLLLHTVGDLMLSADDDTVCRVGIPPDQRDGVVFSSEPDPLQLRFFDDRRAALESVRYVERDFLALHEQWLGGAPPSLQTTHEQEGDLSFDLVQSPLLRRLETQSWRAMVTLTGSVGDSAWDNPYFYLFHHGETFARLTQSEREYRAARATREIIQATDRTTITDKPSPMFAMCLGMDNRHLLPPFPPIGRAEDVVFGATLSKCFDAACSVYLPWLLQHAPSQKRAFSAQQPFVVGPNTLLLSCIDLFDSQFAGDPTNKLLRLGQFIEDFGHMPGYAFEAFVKHRTWQSMSALVSDLEERLVDDQDRPPAYWMRDARAFITHARQNALAPVDQLIASEGGRQALQSYTARFGQALTWWPAIVEAARELRSEGVRLAPLV